MHEWPLLIFTVAIPAAVGGILFLWLLSGKLAKSGIALADVLRLPLAGLAVTSLIGLVGSFFHLGSPLNAIHMMRGFGRSWMSNEIVLAGAFIGLLCIGAGMVLVYKKVNPILMLVTGLVGLAAIYAMGSAYTVTRVNGWDHLNTYVVFYGTAFALGPVLATALLAPKLSGEQLRKVIQWAFAFGIFGIGIQLIGTAMFSAYSTEVQMVTGGTAADKLAPYSGMIGIRWAIEILALGVIGYLSLNGKQKVNYTLVVASLLVFIVAEGMSRYVFYVLGS
ncbi:cyclic nucleotide-binding protein [Bacillus sp. FJAT-18017]|uniref:dimethyl sulfoxide reductase anchor subunit family protein n=1 Tax=Bacillus sp. FJAT-18017 TaxID=1705566 RepID=UPI0006AEC551|nr:DmsC/YnfH family molybdoenzyme membrane anchor subunit [Bacillus sp. FJAT-18017]ALC91307.1 cyclic nucleotide-binding protein [Bacillus sp. FJAT-18017]